MGIRDVAIGLVYVVGILLIGYVTTGRQTDTEEYFRGSKALPWWAIGLSIIATSFSAASILGGPGEGYENGLAFLQLQIGDLIGFSLVCFVFLPIYLRLDITSAYAYLERRFDLKTRWLGALFFLVFVLIRLGGLLYGASLLFARVTGSSVSGAIVAIGLVAIFYTIIGGISAVVWTDVVQFVMIVLGITLSFFCIERIAGEGFGRVWTAASQAGKLQVFDFSWNPRHLRTLPSVVFGYSFMAFAVAGVIQQSVQRYVSCKDLKDSVKATMLGWFSGFVGMTLTLLLGALLFVLYRETGLVLPAEVADNPDDIFSYFVVETLPDGVTGVLVVAVFAAAMSSIDSALHSLSTSVVVDFVRRSGAALRYVKSLVRSDARTAGADPSHSTGFPDVRSSDEDREKSPDRQGHDLSIARWIIGVFGVLGIAAALIYAAYPGQTLLSQFVRLFSLMLGPLLGLFLLGVLVPRATANGAFFGVLVTVVYTIFLVYGWSYVLSVVGDVWWMGPFLSRFGTSFPLYWVPAFSIPVTLGAGYLLSLFEEPPEAEELEGLVRFVR